MRRLRKASESILGRDDAFDLLKPYYDEFEAAVQNGLDAYGRESPEFLARLTPRTKACILNDCVAGDLEQQLLGHAAVRINEDFGFKVFVFDGRAALRVKKVDEHDQPKNAETDQQTSLEAQQLELPGFPRAKWVTLGYHLDLLWEKALWVHLICRENGERRWVLPVTSDPIQARLFPDRPDQQTTPKARVRSKLRGKDEA
jgi:hypothetical protein